MAKRTKRAAWGLVVALAVVLGGAGLLSVRHGRDWVLRRQGAGLKLSRTHLRGADLAGGNLIQINLSEAHLEGANLRGAQLAGATLRRADLRRADLVGAVLVDRRFGYADLTGANLCGADLRRACLVGPGLKPGAPWVVVLRDARYDAHTRWPSGFDPVKAGAVLVR